MLERLLGTVNLVILAHSVEERTCGLILGVCW